MLQKNEWRDFVFQNPPIGRDFAQAKLEVLLSEKRDVVHAAYALGLAEYLMGRHLMSNNWYEYALNQPEFRKQKGPVWSDEEKALRKQSALYNNIGINCEIMEDWVAAEAAYARSRAIDLQLGDAHGAWMTAINMGLLRFRENQNEEARHLLQDAVDFFSSHGDDLNKGRALLNLAAAEEPLLDPDPAEQHAKEALRIFETLGDSTEAARALLTWAHILDSRGDQGALSDILGEIERGFAQRMQPQAQYAALILRGRHARHLKDWSGLDELLSKIDSTSKQFPDLPRSDMEFELRIAAAQARDQDEVALSLFREHSEKRLEQFGNKSAAMLAEVWEINDREAQMHLNEQLQLKLSFARRLNWFSGMALLLVLVSVALFLWKRKSDLRNHLVIIRLLRRHLMIKPNRSNLPMTPPAPPHLASENEEEPATPFFQELFASIEDLVARETLHRVSSTSLGDLASKLNSNPKYVSQAIRQETAMSYSDYINMLRVQDAQHMLLEEKDILLSLDQIADQCGFGSRRTFYRQFTKFTGMPPGQFLKLSQADRAAHLERNPGYALKLCHMPNLVNLAFRFVRARGWVGIIFDSSNETDD